MGPTETAPLLAGHEHHGVPPDSLASTPQQSIPSLGPPTGSARPKRLLSFWDGLALVLGLQIGSGIFVSPALVVRSVGSEGTALLIWVIGGTLAWACAACYVEMGTRLPINGGPQEYLAYCFSDLFGFVASWGCIFTVKPCSAAVLALSIAEYACDALALVPEAGSDTPSSERYRKTAALLVVALVTAINCAGNHLSNLSTKILLACKVGGVGFVIIMGFAVLVSSHISSSPTVAANVEPVSPDLGSYTDALLAAMWAYSGWETNIYKLAFVGGELQNPHRNIPRVINTAMVIVVLLSVFSNIAYFSVLSFDEIVRSTTIGLTFSEHFLGRAGGVAYTALICLSSFGTLNVKTFTAGRLTQAAAERGYLPPLVMTVANQGRDDSNNGDNEDNGDNRSTSGKSSYQANLRQRILGTFQRPLRFQDGTIPFSAIIFNSLLTCIFVLVGDLRSLISFIGKVIVIIPLSSLILFQRLRSLPALIRNCRVLDCFSHPCRALVSPVLPETRSEDSNCHHADIQGSCYCDTCRLACSWFYGYSFHCATSAGGYRVHHLLCRERCFPHILHTTKRIGNTGS
ncbi:amino acid permease-domain-containing protein [Apiosordaria backusii]|uniref:Amino acid permease-domain-containing protein n=1 Tax=Apiosordaria backusii TaxID=314023 RepID=A0AA39ZPS4_9PEZI|nr:amino acid permease-domain-containing protein [Apiosordaria backusii]